MNGDHILTMHKLLLPVMYIIGLMAVLAFATTNQIPQTPPLIRTGAMTLPQNYRETFVQYMTVDRVDYTVRKLYIHPAALEQLQQGEDLPEGTQLIIETYEAQRSESGLPLVDDAGRYIAGELSGNIHMSEKRSTWTRADLATPGIAIDWNFASFDPQTYQPTDENRNDCFTCHDANAVQRDFAISRQVIDRFVSSGGMESYLFCHRRERASCL